MSGGSFDYAYREMEDGLLGKFAGYAGRFVSHLDRLAGAVERGEVVVFEASGRRKPTEAERASWALAVGAALVAFERARADVARLEVLMRELAPLAHAIEWSQSGDTGDDNTARECLAWARKRLGLEGA